MGLMRHMEDYSVSTSYDYKDKFARFSSILASIFSKQSHAGFRFLPISLQSSKPQSLSFCLVSLLAIMTWIGFPALFLDCRRLGWNCTRSPLECWRLAKNCTRFHHLQHPQHLHLWTMCYIILLFQFTLLWLSMDLNSTSSSKSTYESAFEKFLAKQKAENDFTQEGISSPHHQPNGGELPCEPLSPCKSNWTFNFYFSAKYNHEKSVIFG